jgi:hypothetical protein
LLPGSVSAGGGAPAAAAPAAGGAAGGAAAPKEEKKEEPSEEDEVRPLLLLLLFSDSRVFSLHGRVQFISFGMKEGMWCKRDTYRQHWRQCAGSAKHLQQHQQLLQQGIRGQPTSNKR